MTQDSGGNSGSRADASSPQAVSTKGFDPGRELLTKVLAYYEGEKPYDFHRLSPDQRENEAFDTWLELASEIRAFLKEAA